MEKIILKFEARVAECFLSYSKERLREFIAKVVAERAMLVLSLDAKDRKNEEREAMLGVLERLQGKAIEELKRR